MVRNRKGRDIHGVLLLDKPKDMSSNDALQVAKRIFKAKKAGHTGALDPLATGMLPICFGESTKFSQYLLDSDKRYRVIAKLGQRTDTSDAEGQIISERKVELTESQIKLALTDFLGDIKQVPTMFSALKHQGRPLYEYARKGIVIEREARDITIYQNTFISLKDNLLELEIHCSKGTYIRTIIDDLGEKLGCGAHIIYLRRLQVSKYCVKDMITLDELKQKAEQFDELDKLLLDIDSPVQDYPLIILTNEQADDVLLGRTIKIAQQSLSKTLVRLYKQQQFIGMANWHENLISPKRLIQTHEQN